MECRAVLWVKTSGQLHSENAESDSDVTEVTVVWLGYRWSVGAGLVVSKLQRACDTKLSFLAAAEDDGK